MLSRILAVVSGGSVAALGCGKSAPPAIDAAPAASAPAETATPTTCPESIGDHTGEVPQSMNRPGYYKPVCFPLPPGGASACDATYSKGCILQSYSCGVSREATAVEGRMEAKDACCWKVSGHCAVGRPFVVEGRAVVARLRGERGWGLPDEEARIALASVASGLEATTREAIARVWCLDGLAEHASVASFAQLVLELLGLGAPASLVSAASRALGEEVAHAQRAFMLASLYAGRPWGPGALDVSGAVRRPASLAELAARTASESCVAETIAALQLHAAADAAAEPALQAILRATAEEESEHALLGWNILAWANATGGDEVRSAVEGIFSRATAHVGFGPCPEQSSDDDILRSHGVLSRRDRHDLAVASLAAVILPAARALARERWPAKATSCARA